jgi:hypothetical protein
MMTTITRQNPISVSGLGFRNVELTTPSTVFRTGDAPARGASSVAMVLSLIALGNSICGFQRFQEQESRSGGGAALQRPAL